MLKNAIYIKGFRTHTYFLELLGRFSCVQRVCETGAEEGLKCAKVIQSKSGLTRSVQLKRGLSPSLA